MPQIILEMNEHKEFFKSELGQAVLNEMAKKDSLEMLRAVAECNSTSKGTLAYIVKRLTVDERAKYNNDDYAFSIIQSVTGNNVTDTETLDNIYEFAMKLIARYKVGSMPHRIAMTIFEGLAVHPNTSEEKLRKLVADNDSFEQFVVQNPGISDDWLIEIVENSTSQVEKLAAVPQLVRRLKAKLQEQSSQA